VSLVAPKFRWIDTRNPLFWRCVLPPHYSVEEFAREFDLATEVIRTLPPGRRFVYFVDMSEVTHSDPRNRNRVARFLVDCEAPLRLHMIAWGMVIPNSVMRGAITAISWLGKFPVPLQVFDDARECEHWLDQQLALDQLSREGKTARAP
jgi:hypothetical protein